MNQWTFFQYLYTHFDTTFLAAVQRTTGYVLAGIQAPLLVGVTLWLAGTMAMELYEPNGEPILLFVRKLIRAGIVLFAVVAANYTDIFNNFMLTTLPNALVSMAVGGAGVGPLTPNAFDIMLGQSWASGLEIYKGLSFWSSDGVGLMFAVVAYWLLSAANIGFAFIQFMLSHVLLGVSIAAGPLFICCLLAPRTELYFNGWVSVTLGLIVTQVCIVILLSVLLTVEADIMKQISLLIKPTGSNIDNEAAQLHYLIEGGIIFGALGYLTKKVAEMAQAIMGGIMTHVAPISRMAGQALSGTARAISAASGGGAKADAGLGGGAAGLRSLTPAGAAR